MRYLERAVEDECAKFSRDGLDTGLVSFDMPFKGEFRTLDGGSFSSSLSARGCDCKL